MATFERHGRGPAAVVMAVAAMAMVMVLSAQVAQAAPYYEKFGPFYQHDIVSRPNFTDLIVSRGYTKTEGFGALSTFDDPLTVKPDFNSEVVARVQGFQAIAALDASSVVVTQTLHLPGGTLSFVGSFSFMSAKPSRFHFVGGTGDYASVVSGIYELEVYKFNDMTLDTILIATVYYHKSEKKEKALRMFSNME